MAVKQYASERSKWLRSAISAVIAVAWLAACTTPPPVDKSVAYSPQELLIGDTFGLESGDRPPAVDITAIDPQMRAFLKQKVPQHFSDEHKIRRILEAILEDELQLDYNSFKTYTAREAFYSREGNCLSFTNLFVALAREAGLDVYYQEVEVPPNWEQQGDTYFFNRHINALVHLQFSGKKAVDFNISEFDHDYPRREITDSYARAQYYNNMGIYWLGEGRHDQAFLHVREAIAQQPYAAYFWTNLGAIYSQSGEKNRAESAWLRALELDDDPSAMSNLARLYEGSGELALSDWYEARVERYRRKNPYYLHGLAKEAYNGADYEQAIALSKKSVRLKDDEHEFHRLLGLSYLHQGNVRRADRSFAHAAKYAPGEQERKRYNDKRKLLVHVNH